MRTFPYMILCYLALGIQVGISGYANVGSAWPNVVLLAAVFIAINAPRDPALLECIVLGLFQDLLTSSPLGLWALAYGVVGMFVISTQEIVYREHFLTHFSLGLVGGLLSGAVLVVHGWLYPMMHAGVRPAHVSLVTCFTSALYTGLLAPVVLGLLQRTKRAFGFRPAGRGSGIRR